MKNNHRPILWSMIATILVLGGYPGMALLNAQDSSAKSKVNRGKYIATIAGCNDCHTPKIMTRNGPVIDTTRLLSGHPENAELPEFDFSLVSSGRWILMSGDQTAAAGPWGVSFAANLTPDDQTGIGLWTPENFKAALRSGKHMGIGRRILPPMPWFNYSKMTDGDLEALFAYLKSLKPIKNKVPSPIPPEQLKQE